MPLIVWVIGAGLAVPAATMAFILYFEPRKQHHIWHEPRVTPQQTRDDIDAVLEVIGTVSQGREIRWWLDYGTLLGALRCREAPVFLKAADGDAPPT